MSFEWASKAFRSLGLGMVIGLLILPPVTLGSGGPPWNLEPIQGGDPQGRTWQRNPQPLITDQERGWQETEDDGRGKDAANDMIENRDMSFSATAAGEDVTLTYGPDNETVTVDELFGDETADDSLRSVHGSPGSIEDAGDAKHHELMAGDGHTAEAYQLVTSQGQRNRPDIRNDPSWQGIEDLNAMFYEDVDENACSEQNGVREYVSCRRNFEPSIPNDCGYRRVIQSEPTGEEGVRNLVSEAWELTNPACEINSRPFGAYCSRVDTCTEEVSAVLPPDGEPGEVCLIIDGDEVCGQYTATKPYPGLPQGCLETSSNWSCYNFPGQTGPDTCRALEDNPQCGFVASECADNATDSSGNCYAWDERFSCQTETSNSAVCLARAMFGEEFGACEREVEYVTQEEEVTFSNTHTCQTTQSLSSCETFYDLGLTEETHRETIRQTSCIPVKDYTVDIDTDENTVFAAAEIEYMEGSADVTIPQQPTSENDWETIVRFTNDTEVEFTQRVHSFEGCFDTNLVEVQVANAPYAEFDGRTNNELILYESIYIWKYGYIVDRNQNWIDDQWSGAYNVTSLRNSDDDNMSGIYYLFNPLDLSALNALDIAEFNAEVTNISLSHESNVSIYIDQYPDASNGWMLRFGLEDWGTAGGYPPCPGGTIVEGAAWVALDIDVTVSGSITDPSGLNVCESVNDSRCEQNCDGTEESRADVVVRHGSVDPSVIDEPAEPFNQPCMRESDDFYDVTWTCDEEAPVTIGNTVIDDSATDVFPELYPNAHDDGLCLRATGVYSSTAAAGDSETFCYENLEGESLCTDVDTQSGGILEANQCADLDDRVLAGECVYQGQEPLELDDASVNHDYLQERVYSCVDDDLSSTVETVSVFESYQCEGISCMGEDCVPTVSELSEEFDEAVSYLQVLEMAGNDTECDPMNPSDCRVFSGEANECKRAIGGIVNCCESPSGVSLVEYIQLISAVNKLDGYLVNADFMPAAQGAWSTMRSPVTSAWDKATQPFTSMMDGLTGSTTEAASEAAAEGIMSQWKEEAIKKTADLVGPDVGSFFFEYAESAGTDVATGGLASNFGTALSVIGTAYTIYNVTMLIANIVWECSETELQLGVDRQLRKTVRIGNYCAKSSPFGCIERRTGYCVFNAPLPRIIQEQARPQLGMDWGRPKEPACEGIRIEDLDKINWEAIDLSEWSDMLMIADQLPSQQELSIEQLTGMGSDPDVMGDRKSTDVRVFERAEDVDVSDIYQDSREEAWGQQIWQR